MNDCSLQVKARVTVSPPRRGLLEETVGAGHMTATLKQMRAARERRWRKRVKAECMITAAQREVGVKTKSSEEHGKREESQRMDVRRQAGEDEGDGGREKLFACLIYSCHGWILTQAIWDQSLPKLGHINHN